MHYNTRRLIIALSMLVAPLWVEAQQPAKVWRIGLFHVGLDHVPPSLDTLRDGLRALSYEEGKNLIFDWRNLPDEAAARPPHFCCYRRVLESSFWKEFQRDTH